MSLHEVLGLSMEEAIGYVGLPRVVSEFNGMPIVAAIGPYGPYLKYNNTFMSLNTNDGDVLTVDPETAEQLVTDGIINKTSKLGRGVIGELGEKEGSKVTIKAGRFGMYLNWKRVNAKLPVEYVDNPEDIPLDQAWSLIQGQAASKPAKGKRIATNSNDSRLPPAPKRPKSAYLHFCTEKRPQVAETVKMLGDVSKRLAALWSETSEKDRERFVEMALQGKMEYEEEKQLWDAQGRDLKTLATTKLRKVTKPSKTNTKAIKSPQRPRSSYIFFCAARRPEVVKRVKSLGDISKELACLWSETTDRSEFESLAVADRRRYEDDMTMHTGDSKKNAAVKVTSEGKRIAPETATPFLVRRAPSAYMLFCKDKRHLIVDDSGTKLPFGETTKLLAEMWRECDVETRAAFNELAACEKEKLTASSVVETRSGCL
jgi:HMG (high mobility group) box/Topoisomerase C-terminal repeat